MSRLISRAEGWERAYEAFQNVNFAAFDYASVKQSIIDYIKLYFPETFNDYIESSEFIAIVETFAYIAEMLAYRLDVNAHENFISTAQRRDSILRLAKLVSYTPSRSLSARGLVKITSVTTTENVLDTNGNNLANVTIRWNDTSNASWKEQFTLVMNRVMDQEFGTVGPYDRFQIQDVLFELYTWNLNRPALGVFKYTANVNGQSIPMELVPVAYDPSAGIVERRPANNSAFTFLYGSDGLGDGSDTTGFFCFTKQGELQRFRTEFDGVTPNQTYDVNVNNVNDTDVWVNNVDPETGFTLDTPFALPYKRPSDVLTGEWQQVDLAYSQNVIFNTNPFRNKYEVETRDNDNIRLIFGDGEFADIPSGTFDVWVRTSVNEDLVVPQSSVANTTSSFTYVDTFGQTQTLTFTFTLINSLQNASATESLDQVRLTAPAVYYTQDRMVNAEDYNVFMLQDPSILKLRSVNRTFAGDSAYIAWHDPSQSYENVKMFSDDGLLYYDITSVTETTPAVEFNQLIETYVQPLLSSTDIFLQLVGAGVPVPSIRRTFNTAEKALLNTALTPPPAPTVVNMYFNLVDYQWYAIKGSDDPTTSTVLNTGFVYPANYIATPLITITQISTLETRYVVSRLAKRLIVESQTTEFWNTNEGNRVLDYDTLRANFDQIAILKANVNCSRTGVLKDNWTFDVLGQEIITSGSEVGLPDIHRISVIPSDTNQDKVPDYLDPNDLTDPRGLADILQPKLIVTNVGTVTLPTYYIAAPTSAAIADIQVIGSSAPMIKGTHWNEVSPSTIGNTINIVSMNGNASVTVLVTEYVYFARISPSDEWYPANTTYESITAYVLDQAAALSNPSYIPLWKRNQGRNELNFLWTHFTPKQYLVDPAPSNIIDTFIITKSYYVALKRWLSDPLANRPSDPTPLDLRTSYGYLLDNKMISDTVILHPGRVKLLFGPRAPAPLQCVFSVIRSEGRTLSDNQIKTRIVDVIRNYFDISGWEFGETFYFTELAAAIHATLPTEISSVVLVPSFEQNQFGDMFQILSREDEVFYPDVSVDQIEIVAGYTSTNLRLNG